MRFSKGVSVVAFVGALLIGLVVSAWVSEIMSPAATLDVWQTVPPVKERDIALRAEDLIGRWKGSWNYWGDSGGTCTIDIDRVEGNSFYGTVSQDEAKVTFEGTFDPETGRVFFQETHVLRVGAYSEWLLGTYIGSLTEDGRTLSGSGKDSYSGYDWSVTRAQGGTR